MDNSWRRVCGLLLILFVSASASASALQGNISVVTDGDIISQPYPNGPRSTVPNIEQYQCTMCDMGAPTEQCFPELNLCAELSDTAIALFGMNGVFLSSASLDRSCHPRYLQRLAFPGLHLSVDCYNFTSQVATIAGNMVSVHGQEGWTVQSEIVVEGTGVYQVSEVHIVEIKGDNIGRTNFHGGLYSDITPNTNCSDFLLLFPLFTRDKFLLWCDSNTGSKVLYIVDAYDYIDLDSPPSIFAASPPLSSPDGQTFITVTNSTLRIYRTDSITSKPPGVREFTSAISFHTYINDNMLLLVINGQGQVLVNVNEFIDSSGTEGIIPLPTASADATLHKLLTPGVYATYNKTGALFNLLLFNTSDGHLLKVFANFESEPTNIFFQETIALTPTQTPTIQTPVMPSPSTTSSTTSAVSSYVEPAQTPSSLSLLATLPLTPTMVNDDPVKSKVIKPAIIITVSIISIAGFMIVACVLFLYMKKWGPRSSICTFRRKSPTEETLEEGLTHQQTVTASQAPLNGHLPGYKSVFDGHLTNPIQETSNGTIAVTFM